MATTPGSGAKVLVVGLALGAVTAGFLYVYLRKMSESPRSNWQRVLVARVPITANTKFAQEMVTMVVMPPESIVPNAVRDPRAIGGKLARHNLAPHEQILESHLMLEGEVPSLALRVPEGRRAIAIAANEIIAVGSVVKPGDRVDILATYRDPSANEETTQMILQNVPVLAVNQGQTDPVTSSGAKTSMTLAVAPEDTERIAAADRAGVLRIALRAPRDVSLHKGAGVTLKDFAFGKTRAYVPAAETKESSEVPSPFKTAVTPVTITTTNISTAVEKPHEIVVYRGTEAKTVVP
jgi:pilus assembly protein CpaB